MWWVEKQSPKGWRKQREGERERDRKREQSSFPKKERNKINMRHYARH